MRPARHALVVWATTVLAAATATYLAARYAFSIAGDAVIHLSLMETSAIGRWFEFNPGHPEAASSSVLWTILGAGFMRLGGVTFGVVAVKAVCFAAWALIGVLVHRCARDLGADHAHALLAGCLAVAMPGTAQNCLLGMENGLFAVLVLGALHVNVRPSRRGSAAGVFLLVGLACALRPEGVVLLGAMLAARAATLREDAPKAAAAIACTWIPCLVFYFVKTGHIVPASGIARVMAARREVQSLHLGPLWLYGSPLTRVAAYGPLAAGAWWKVRAPTTPKPVSVAYGATLVGGLLFYSLVTGAFHTSRYMIWLFAPACALAGAYASRMASNRARVLGLSWMVAMIAAELWLRPRLTGIGIPVRDVVAAPAHRGEYTDRSLASICAGGCCGAFPEIAAFEVEERFWLDGRVGVVSVDGVTSGPHGRPVTFSADGCPNLEDIADDPDVVAVHGDLPSRFPRCVWAGPAASMARASAGHPEPGWQNTDFGALRVCPPRPPGRVGSDER